MGTIPREGQSGARAAASRRRWPAILIRVFGVANLVLGGVGVYTIAGSLRIIAPGPHGSGNCGRQAYYTMTYVDLACVLVMLVAGVCLLRSRHFGLAICNWLFGFQVVYLFAILALGGLLSEGPGLGPLSTCIALADGIGNMGTALEVGPVYPVVALVVLNIAYMRLRQPNQACVA